jgi:hypothetical protein
MCAYLSVLLAGMVWSCPVLHTCRCTALIFSWCPGPYENDCRVLVQHVYIPLLPASMMGFIQAPMPFIVGIHRYARPPKQASRFYTRARTPPPLLYSSMFRQQVQGPGHARGRDPGRLGTFLVCHYVTHMSAGLMASPKCVTCAVHVCVIVPASQVYVDLDRGKVMESENPTTPSLPDYLQRKVRTLSCDCNRGRTRTALCGAQPIPWDVPLVVPVQVTLMKPAPYYGNLYHSIDWLLLPRSSLPGCMRTRTSRRGTLRHQSLDTQTSRSRSLMTRSPAEESSCLPCRTPPSNACPATLRTAQVSLARDHRPCLLHVPWDRAESRRTRGCLLVLTCPKTRMGWFPVCSRLVVAIVVATPLACCNCHRKR